MEFRDLKRQYQIHKEAIDRGIQEVIDSTHFISGGQVAQLEEKLAQYVGVKHCVACANGTDALQLALMAWEVTAGDAVFVPDFTFFSSGEVVPLVGAVPVFVDIDADTYNIDCESLEKAIEYVIHHTDLRPRVIVAVNLFGQPADFNKIREIAAKYDMLVLEDAAQGFGGMIGKEKACSFGDIATTSFFPAKPLGCYGDGGAIFTDDDAWTERLRSLHVHGKGGDKYDNVRIGMNSRLDTLQAAVLLEKMNFFEEEVEKCNQAAAKYTERLQSIVKTPVVLDGMRSSWAQYTICLKDAKEREKVMEQLKKDGIPSAVYYKKPMHLQKAFAEGLAEAVSCVRTEDICGRCVSLPMHPYLQDAEIEAVCESIERAVL
ncbi:MAG: DegT/DnrJ/EryC1/StrS family aminotransferase [Lachnospiraceae bacterium]|nr:DegT/DnrJ/EryC1/StrS family aminotransferase [Lachnospiraceae bacterium]